MCDGGVCEVQCLGTSVGFGILEIHLDHASELRALGFFSFSAFFFAVASCAFASLFKHTCCLNVPVNLIEHVFLRQKMRNVVKT